MTDPDQSLAIRKGSLDVSRIFLAYLTCGGDVVQAAQVGGCRLEDVLFLAKEELWDKKMTDAGIVRAKGKDEMEIKMREINRLTCYIQAARLRSMIDLTLKWCFEDGETRIVDFNQETDKLGNKAFSTKPMLDLVKAAGEVHNMIYRSLGDVVDKEKSGNINLSDIKNLHMTVVAAMSEGAGIPEATLKAVEPLATQTPTKKTGFLDIPASDVLDDKH